MKAKREITKCLMTAVAASLMLATTSQADAKTLKVFILAGQSNMEGPASVKTFDYLTPPDAGQLAHIDPALIMTPPKGLEAGYVPIATRQELE